MPLPPLVPKKCDVCGTTYLPNSQRQKYCSIECKRGVFECVECNAKFVRKSKTTGRYCSLECWYGSERERVTVVCAFCGDTIVGRGNAKTCSRMCAKEMSKVRRFKTCAVCMVALPENVRERRKFCSRACAGVSTRHVLSRAERNRRRALKKNYGLTYDAYLALFNAQAGRCAICDILIQTSGNTRRSAHVDHDHSTGAVRGLLCASCNLGLGKFCDDPENLERAADYLRRAS